MEQNLRGVKPCIVKINRCNLMDDAEKVRDRILDQRPRKCHVILRRLEFNQAVCKQFKVRPCCVRLPRLTVEYFDALEGYERSSSSRSVLSERDLNSDIVHSSDN